MLLAIDVGNTNTKIALCDDAGAAVEWSWRVSTLRDRMPDEWYALLVSLLRTVSRQGTDISAVALSSVVPNVTSWIGAMCRARLNVDPLLIDHTANLGIQIATDQPTETGIDRIVNGVAAFSRFGGPVVVVDCGTATKFDVVSGDGRFLGGAIGSGLAASLEVLAGRAARLYPVDLQLPEFAIGTNTVASVQSGIVLGYVAMCEGMIARVLAELDTSVPVIATGGAGELISKAVARVDRFEPSLTIDGIRLVYQRTRGIAESFSPEVPVSPTS